MELRFFELYRSSEYMYLLLEGAAVSFSITAVAGFLGFLFAFFLAGLSHFEVPLAQYIALIYVVFIRNTPLIVQLFFIAFGFVADGLMAQDSRNRRSRQYDDV